MKRNSSFKTVIPTDKNENRISTVTMTNIAAPSEVEHYTDSLQGEQLGRKTVQYDSQPSKVRE